MFNRIGDQVPDTIDNEFYRISARINVMDLVSKHWTYRLDIATLSTSIFFLMQAEFGLLAAHSMISSAKHSAIDLMFLNALFLAPSTINAMAMLIRVNGATSTACLRTTPALPTLVESSRGPPFSRAWRSICSGLHSLPSASLPFVTWIISRACLTMDTALLRESHLPFAFAVNGSQQRVSKCHQTQPSAMRWNTYSFFPLFLPCIIKQFANRSTIGHIFLRNRFFCHLPAVWGCHRALQFIWSFNEVSTVLYCNL